MGGFASQVQAPQASQPQAGGGKLGSTASQVPAPTPPTAKPSNLSIYQDDFGFGSQPQPMGKGGRQTNSATSGQPRMGQQNQYSNTVGQWDNTQIQPVSHGKGKGG